MRQHRNAVFEPSLRKMRKKTLQEPRLSPPVHGWVLVARDESDLDLKHADRPYYVAWHEVFSRRKTALDFARNGLWPKGFRAVRGSISVTR